jgi:hypothetical protein
MATTDEIREKLRKQAEQRVNPLMRGLSLLTGGLAGEFTGTNESIRNRELARRSLIDEDLAALKEERLFQRMEAERKQRLEDELRLITERDKTAAETRAKEFAEKREAQRPTLIGQLRARPDYQLGGSMAMPIPALESTESLEEQASYEKARQEQEEEARKIKSGYMQYNIGGRTIGGTPDQIAAMAEKDPVLKAFLSKPPSDELPFTTTWDRDSLTGQMNPTVRFTKPVPFDQQKALVDQFFGNQSTGLGKPPPPTGTTATKATKPTSFSGYKVTIAEEEEQK